MFREVLSFVIFQKIMKNHEIYHFFVASPIIIFTPSQSFLIFGATFFTLTELISWAQKSDLRIFLFSKRPIHSNQQKKLFGTGYGRSTGRKTFYFFPSRKFPRIASTYLESVT